MCKNCKHEFLKDWTIDRYSNNPIENLYCPECGWHKLRGVEYTKEEWELYVNEEPIFIPTELEKEYSEWIQSMPTITDNTVFYRKKYDFLKKLSKKYNIRMQRLEKFYEI